MDFILGTAQIGQPYGVVNHTGAIDRDQAAELINFAWKQGIRTIDTAIDYGQSQNILGQVLPHDARIITKLKADPNQHLQAQVELALKTLKRSRVYGVLIHNPESLKDTRIWQRMLELKESGLAEKIGISVYDPDEYLLHSTERNIDILQFPCNLFDQRFLRLDVQKRLKEQNTERHVRSVFLQGILLNDISALPVYFYRFSKELSAIELQAQKYGTSKLALSLAFAVYLKTQGKNCDDFILGVDSLDHLQRIVDPLRAAEKFVQENPAFDWGKLATVQSDLIDPRRWGRK